MGTTGEPAGRNVIKKLQRIYKTQRGSSEETDTSPDALFLFLYTFISHIPSYQPLVFTFWPRHPTCMTRQKSISPAGFPGDLFGVFSFRSDSTTLILSSQRWWSLDKHHRLEPGLSDVWLQGGFAHAQEY